MQSFNVMECDVILCLCSNSAQVSMLKQGMCSLRHSLIKDLQRSYDQHGLLLGDR